MLLTKKKEDSLLQPLETSDDIDFADDLSCPPTSTFSWPPPPEDDQSHPTASPLYIPPPGTQRVQVTHKKKRRLAFFCWKLDPINGIVEWNWNEYIKKSTSL